MSGTYDGPYVESGKQLTLNYADFERLNAFAAEHDLTFEQFVHTSLALGEQVIRATQDEKQRVLLEKRGHVVELVLGEVPR